jgi:hypothetical protein
MVVQLSTFAFAVPSESEEAPAPGRMTWDEAFAKADGLRKWGDDWDGQGASAPSSEHIDACRVLLEAVHRDALLPPPTFVAGAPDGGVCVEWQWVGISLGAEVADDRIEWMLFREGAEAEFFDTTWDLQPMDD